MVTRTAPSPGTAGMAAVARRYDAAVAGTAAPATRLAATEPSDGATLAPAAYSANAAVSRTADESRGSLVDVLA